jgi:Fic family protein
MPGRYIAKRWSFDPTIDAPAKYKRACAYDAYVPDELTGLPVHLDGTLAGLISDAERAIRALNDFATPALVPLARLLLRTESIASSKVEGMQLGIQELARAEARVESGMKASETAREVLANIDAMTLAVDEAASVAQFTRESILAIHRRLMEQAPNKRSAGQIRVAQNWIGGNDYNPCGADFVPPPPEEVDRLLEDLCAAVNDDLLPPVVQAALVHAQFESIHPFDDGNGRTGRALIHVVLRRRGVAPAYLPPISVVLAAGKRRYIDALMNFRRNEPDGMAAWLEHFAAAAARAANLAKAYVTAVASLTDAWRVRLAQSASAPRAGAAAWAVIDVLPAHPMITGPVATAATGRAKSQVYHALDQLESAGVLNPLTESKRNRAWEAVGLLDLIAGLEAGTLPAPAPSV